MFKDIFEYDRLPKGAVTMKKVSEELNISRANLCRRANARKIPGHYVTRKGYAERFFYPEEVELLKKTLDTKFKKGHPGYRKAYHPKTYYKVSVYDSYFEKYIVVRYSLTKQNAMQIVKEYIANGKYARCTPHI